MLNLSSYTCYSLILTIGMVIGYIPLTKMIGINMIMVGFVGNSMFIMYHHKRDDMMKWNLLFHVVPLYPLFVWYRYSDKIGYWKHDWPWYWRFCGQILFFLLWAILPYHDKIFMEKAIAIYHHVHWWYLLEYFVGSVILHLLG